MTNLPKSLEADLKQLGPRVQSLQIIHYGLTPPGETGVFANLVNLERDYEYSVLLGYWSGHLDRGEILECFNSRGCP